MESATTISTQRREHPAAQVKASLHDVCAGADRNPGKIFHFREESRKTLWFYDTHRNPRSLVSLDLPHARERHGTTGHDALRMARMSG